MQKHISLTRKDAGKTFVCGKFPRVKRTCAENAARDLLIGLIVLNDGKGQQIQSQHKSLNDRIDVDTAGRSKVNRGFYASFDSHIR